MMTKDVTVRNYEVQQFTGRPVSTVGRGQWARGKIVRQGTIELQPPRHGLTMYDPTNPLTWNLQDQPQ